MKHKKLFWIVGVLLALLSVGMSAAQYITAAVDAATLAAGEAPSWQTIVMDRVVPDAVQLVTEVGSVIMMLWPAIFAMQEKVTGTCHAFDVATDGVNRVSADGTAVQEEVRAAREDTKAALAEASEAKQHVALLCEVVGMLACGNDALVKNGTARRIMEVLEREGKN